MEVCRSRLPNTRATFWTLLGAPMALRFISLPILRALTCGLQTKEGSAGDISMTKIYSSSVNS